MIGLGVVLWLEPAVGGGVTCTCCSTLEDCGIGEGPRFVIRSQRWICDCLDVIAKV